MNDYTPKVLRRTQFGNPILQTKTRQLTNAEVQSREIKELIADMKYTLSKKRYGVGIAATQIGRDLAISVIDIKPTPTRPNATPFSEVIINPQFTGIGQKADMWEGCISMGATTSPLFAKTRRYKIIKATWLDEKGEMHAKELEGLPAHVFQHETDHLNGVLFPERITDHTSWMNASEYKKRIAAKQSK